MSVQPAIVPPPEPHRPRLSLVAPRVHTLVTLGDSTAAGLGDPMPGGGWRGFPVLLAEALGARLVNPAVTGARVADVRRDQLPVALAAEPDVAVVFVGMNDTLRSDFDPARMRADLAATVGALRSAGAHVVLMRYHDHTRVFPLPAPLRRALWRRVVALNAAVDAVVDGAVDGAADGVVAAGGGIGVLDLDALPGGYEPAAWAIDRLHPSELGHRILAAGLATLVADAGFAVPGPVSLRCGGGREVTVLHRAAWLVFKGVPWLVRRGRDLGPVIVQGLAGELRAAWRGRRLVRRPGAPAPEPRARWAWRSRAAPRSATAGPGCRWDRSR
ncbi:SGNH/GDSL hydrolase family protein [Pseudonocardia adelaidensis]|uniref:SGNH/GDSL hydrolase family protein n=1 Tax=Pseudonocardia adelaidensis TaxID=648754 RepID=A0ABP9NNL7_9PSEU